MANTLTTNYELRKPAYNDARWDVPHNLNMDDIDEYLFDKQDIADLNDDIDTHLADEDIPLVAADQIKVLESLLLDQATASDYAGMFLRVGEDGHIELYRMPRASDTEWSDTDTSDVSLTTSGQEVLAKTVDSGLATTDGSYVIFGQVANAVASARTLTIEVFDDTVSIDTFTISVAASETGKYFLVSGALSAAVVTGSEITVEFKADAASSLTLKGTVKTSTITITKAA